MITSTAIYKRDSVGNIRFWQYAVEGDRWQTISGIVGTENPIRTGWTVCTPKSRPTAEEQALFEAEAEQKKKLERDYHRNIADVDTPLMFKPMLAQTYEKVTFPVFSQPKLDGIRCIATSKGLFTRQGKRILACPHIEDALAPLFEDNPILILDGELYNHDLKDDFNKITSVVRKQKPSDLDIEQSAMLIQYHVYDVPSRVDRFNSRAKVVRELDGFHPAIQVVVTHIAVDQDELDDLYSLYMSQGYEGQMVRLDGPYEQKRSKQLLKRKEFQDDEFKIVRIEEGLGNWSGYAKKVTCLLPDGREFGAGIKGDQAFTKTLLDNRDQYVGTDVTVRFFALTPDGVPRFPVAVDFHAGARVS